jgi:hypothetical protein
MNPVMGFMTSLQPLLARKAPPILSPAAISRHNRMNFARIRCSSVENGKGQTCAQDRMAEQMRLLWELEGTVDKKDFAMGAKIQEK